MLLQLVGKRYPLKAVRKLKQQKKKKKKKKEEEEEENNSFQREPAWERKALSCSDLVLYARCNQSCEKTLNIGSPYVE